jgi:hypothetical protein
MESTRKAMELSKRDEFTADRDLGNGSSARSEMERCDF